MYKLSFNPFFLSVFFFLICTTSSANEVWIQQSDALELRETGEIQSLCSDLINSPEKVIMNVRLINEKGETYLYAPSVGIISNLKIGTLSKDGSFIFTTSYRDKFNNAKTNVTETEELLTFKFEFSDSYASMSYLRSTMAEVTEYYKAQARCRE